MAQNTSDAGRPGQRLRTRSAILAAAARLLAEGRTPSVAEVAEAAEVSRRTVYMHFPTLDQLIIDATLGTIARETLGATLDAADQDADVEARVERMAREVQRLSAATEQQGRTLISLTANSPDAAAPSPIPPRGYRRVEWIERAVGPLRSRLPAQQLERLISALAMVIGWEALIVQRDIRALSLSEAEEVSAWAARALVKAALEESRPVKRKRAAPAPSRAARSGRPR